MCPEWNFFHAYEEPALNPLPQGLYFIGEAEEHLAATGNGVSGALNRDIMHGHSPSRISEPILKIDLMRVNVPLVPSLQPLRAWY